jgi:hypothetical protein
MQGKHVLIFQCFSFDPSFRSFLAMKKQFVCAASLALFALGGQAFAVLDTIEPTPAATLLIPYFELDLNDPNGRTTLFSVNNASAAPVLAHVTFWTDQSVPSLDFDIYLTGYDVQTLNVRDILVNGNLPRTGPAISNLGTFSDPDINYPGCNNTSTAGEGPNYLNPALSAGFRSHLAAWHTGTQSPITGNCAGAKTGDNVARGYITIDVSNACSLLFPSDVGYFGPLGSGIASNANVLWGDYFLVNASENFAEGNTAVHIEAEQTAYYGPGDYTFYGRYLAWGATDGREGLGTTFAARYATGGAFDGTDYTIWRDSTSASVAGYSCALQGPTAWYPLELTQGVVFDEQENIFQPTGCPSGDPTCTPDGFFIPNEAQRLAVGSAGIPLPAGFEFGWIYMNLSDASIAGSLGYSQNWVSWSMSAEGRFAIGLDAIQLDNVANPNGFLFPIGGN